jgi:hypothetical protein
MLLCHMKTSYHLIWYLMVLMHYWSSVRYTLLCKILHINSLCFDVTKFFTYTIPYKLMNRHFYSLHVYVTLIHTNVWLLFSKTILQALAHPSSMRLSKCSTYAPSKYSVLSKTTTRKLQEKLHSVNFKRKLLTHFHNDKSLLHTIDTDI